MDDMAVWSHDREQLQALRSEIRSFLRETLQLELKQDRIGAVAQGVPLLGCRVFAGYRTLNPCSRRRFQHKITVFDRLLHEGRIDENEAQQRSLALCAFAKTACSYHFRQRVLAPHFRATAMGETTTAPTATSAAAPGTTTRTTAPSRTGTTTTRTTGTTTTASASPAVLETRFLSSSKYEQEPAPVSSSSRSEAGGARDEAAERSGGRWSCNKEGIQKGKLPLLPRTFFYVLRIE
jgi:hypothetical protein